MNSGQRSRIGLIGSIVTHIFILLLVSFVGLFNISRPPASDIVEVSLFGGGGGGGGNDADIEDNTGEDKAAVMAAATALVTAAAQAVAAAVAAAMLLWQLCRVSCARLILHIPLQSVTQASPVPAWYAFW